MTEDKDSGDQAGRGTAGSDLRRERLAEALRANLRRRKAQAKARKAADTPGETPPDDE